DGRFGEQVAYELVGRHQLNVELVEPWTELMGHARAIRILSTCVAVAADPHCPEGHFQSGRMGPHSFNGGWLAMRRLRRSLLRPSHPNHAELGGGKVNHAGPHEGRTVRVPVSSHGTTPATVPGAITKNTALPAAALDIFKRPSSRRPGHLVPDRTRGTPIHGRAVDRHVCAPGPSRGDRHGTLADSLAVPSFPASPTRSHSRRPRSSPTRQRTHR